MPARRPRSNPERVPDVVSIPSDLRHFQHSTDPDRPGQLLLEGGAPVAALSWSYDFEVRAQTGWFLQALDADGEPDGGVPVRLTVSADVDQLIADRELVRADWLERAMTLELVTASAALDAAERELAD
jgi:hypothetical protein